MSNDYFNPSGTPGPHAFGSSAAMRAEIALISVAFDKIAPLSGNALKLVRINASATGQESVSAIDATPIGSTTPSTGAFTTLSASGGFTGSVTGNASTATALQTARTINGVSFNGTANITVTAAAGTLTGASLPAGVTDSFLTSVGTLGSLNVSGVISGIGSGLTTLNASNLSSGSVPLARLTLLTGQLADAASASNGAGMVAEDLSQNYVAGTIGWWDKNAGVSLLRYMPISKLAAIVAGTNSDDLGPYLQAALDAALASNFELNGHGYTYKSNVALTWQRNATGHSTRLSMHSATLDFTGMGTTGSAFKVGATSTTYFIEQGRIILRDLTLLGPENTALDPRTDAPGTSTVGLDLQFAGGVTLDSVNVFQFYNQCHSLFAFPVKAINCNFRRAWIGLHLDEVSNDQDWDGISLPNCRYPILIKAVSTSLDSGKINNVTIRRAWCEGCRVGPVIDSGIVGGGATPIRAITFEMSYMALITNDHFRFGTVWTLATPDTRGANCTEFISDIRIVGGLFNPQGGVYTATQALVCFDTIVRCRDVFIDTCTLDVDADSDVFRGSPGGGLYISRGFAGISNAKYRISMWDVNGAIARRLSETGGVLVGTNKTATATTGTVGHELKENGVLYTTADSTAAVNTTRLNSDGTLYNFRRDGTSVGSISITTSATTYNTTSDYRRKENVADLDGAAALATVQSWRIRSFTWKVNGAPDVGVLAHELQAVKPTAVHGEKDAVNENGEEVPQGVDYSKLVPELIAAVQYLAARIYKE